MKRLSLKQIVALHGMLIEQTGGIDGLRDYKLLESAYYSSFQTFDGQDIYPSVREKAARLGYGIIRNHPFVDGNKRIGILAMITLLEVNKIYLIYGDGELVQLGLSLADNQMSFEDLINWISRHI